jgi:hypothetical protein
LQIPLGLVAAIFLTPWAIINFLSMFLVLHLFKKEVDLEQRKGIWRWLKIYTFYIFAAITIVFLIYYIFEQPLALIAVDTIEIITILVIK